MLETLAPGFGAEPHIDPAIRSVEVSVPHVAAGIWIATMAVLIIPSVGRTEHRVTEDHLLRAYSVVMGAFPLL